MIFEFFKKLFWKADEGSKKRKASDVAFQNPENNTHFKKRCQDFSSSNHIRIIPRICKNPLSDLEVVTDDQALVIKSQGKNNKDVNNDIQRSEYSVASTQCSSSKKYELDGIQISNNSKSLESCQLFQNNCTLYKNCEAVEYKQYNEILANEFPSIITGKKGSSKSYNGGCKHLFELLTPKCIQQSSSCSLPLNMPRKELLMNEKNQHIQHVDHDLSVQYKPHIFIQINTLRDQLSSKQVIQGDYINCVAHKYDQRFNERIQEIQELKKMTCVLSKHNRLVREAALEKYLNDSMRLCQAVLDEKDLDQDFKTPELTSDMIKCVENALSVGPPDRVLIQKFGLQIRKRDIQTLAGLNWLNDEVINFYMNLLMVRGNIEKYPSVYAMNTFFYPKLVSGGHSSLKRWTRKVDIFTKDLIIIPIHLGVHWCMSVVDFREKSISYYDSMSSPNSKCLQILKQYLNDEHIDKKKEAYKFSNWNFKCVVDIPQQMNGSDCGVFSCMFAEYICANKKLDFTQEDMPYFRNKMVYEILTGQLL